MPDSFAVWIDHKEARVFRMGAGEAERSTVLAPPHHIHHKHPKGPRSDREHPDDAKRFFHEVVEALSGEGGILVVGPSTAKLELIRHVHKHHPATEVRIVGVETVDHPTDGQLVAYAAKYFHQSRGVGLNSEWLERGEGRAGPGA